ncbi:hypothetical protein BDU57DRAFT_446410 [Ampelomyces quisqualis]|uniref:RING-type E3 ubiquitin transferase n=1 Tax=Ampelomyces quisqualis TaxID=50730 RepID=A0A6A5QRH1_AMPQU|nr:hypothetical protein BDU57DRAFT_446410 [Ampelomyces quisqualis]
MPPTTRAARLPTGYVDLTATPDSPPHRRKTQSPTPGPSAKRRKLDLTDDKQRPHASTNALTKPDDKPTTFNTFNCVICMDMPTDLTATACGHLFCHTCLMEALIAGENRSVPGDPRRSQCPVCRKFINRNKPTDIIPLLLKKGLATQPRKKPMPSPTPVAPKVH